MCVYQNSDALLSTLIVKPQTTYAALGLEYRHPSVEIICPTLRSGNSKLPRMNKFCTIQSLPSRKPGSCSALILYCICITDQTKLRQRVTPG